MAQLESRFEEIRSAGAQLVVIAAQKESGLLGNVGDFVGKNQFSFPLLLDKDRRVCKAYGVYHLIGLDALNIARPSALVIDKTGEVKLVYVGANQKDRADLDELITAAANSR